MNKTTIGLTDHIQRLTYETEALVRYVLNTTCVGTKEKERFFDDLLNIDSHCVATEIREEYVYTFSHDIGDWCTFDHASFIDMVCRYTQSHIPKYFRGEDDT